MAPLEAIHQFCVQCVNSKTEVQQCGGHAMYGDQGDETGQCWLYPYRMGRGRPSVKTIRKHCLECMCQSRKEVANCQNYACPLHNFRKGTNPNRTRKGNKILAEEPA